MPQKDDDHIDWIQHKDLQNFLGSTGIPNPWFTAYSSKTSRNFSICWFSALVPTGILKDRLDDFGWDFYLDSGRPSIWTHYVDGKPDRVEYCAFGNEDGIEPLVIIREFSGLRDGLVELSQEFRLYHNLYLDQRNNCYLIYDSNGDESVAARYSDKLIEVRADLLLDFCSTKQMALGIYVESFRHSASSLQELGLNETRFPVSGSDFTYHVVVAPDTFTLEEDFKTAGGLIGKKYIRPSPIIKNNEEPSETYQDFIIGSRPDGQPVRHTCDPGKLADFFGKNPDAPNYLTPVYFRAEVLTKYYADPQKYSVEDGFLRCGGMWGMRMDNDHPNYVIAWLGDIGRDLSERERNYWLSFNIAPEGRNISVTQFKRAFLAEPADPERPDLVFKSEYSRFNRDFEKDKGWCFFLPLHEDDKHFLFSLRLLTKDNQAEFDSQLIALTKLVVDSINEQGIGNGLKTLMKNDKGINKLEKFFIEQNIDGYESHISFLRAIQSLRSSSAAHRKGKNYEKLLKDLQIDDAGLQNVFSSILISATEFVRFLRFSLIQNSE